MISRAYISRASVSLVVVAVAFAGCGGTNKAATTATGYVTAGETTPTAAAPPADSVNYSVKLGGAHGGHAGAPNASGLALISFTKENVGELCWNFSQLKNVAAPTRARIYPPAAPPRRMHAIPLGGGYQPSGCIFVGGARVEMIEAHRQRYYVSIENAQFQPPKFQGGAIRGQL